MATATGRGRPKGSGINDDKIIKKITALLTRDPDMKPTTAIKAVGISDPSSIRRLRDKLKSSTPAKKTATKKPAQAKARTKARAKTITTRKASAAKSKAAPKPAAKKKKQTAKKAVVTRTAAASRKAPKKPAGKKTVQTRHAPGKAPTSTADIMDHFGMSNPFSDMNNGMQLPTDFAGLDFENIVSITVEKQIQLYESALKFSPLANLLRQQALMTDMMLTMMRTQKEISKALKK